MSKHLWVCIVFVLCYVMGNGLFTAEMKLCFSLHQHIGLDKNFLGGVISQCILFSILAKSQ